LFPKVAADVAMQAIKEGVALKNLTWDEVYQAAKKDIMEAREITQMLQDKEYIAPIYDEVIEKIMDKVIQTLK
jgi:malate dehydrogenase (oxaloacetate-decarboxylating)